MISTPTKLFRNGAGCREGKTIPITKHLFRAAMIAGTALSLLTAAGPASADLLYNWTLSGTDTGSGTLTAGHPTVVVSTSPRSQAPSTAIQSMACSAPRLNRGGLPSPHSARSFTTT
jgi:hypothetical protein